MFKRIGNLFKGFFGLFIGGFERRNPEALLDVEKENLREQVSKFNKSLAAHAAQCEKLMTLTNKLEADKAELRTKTTAHLKAGNREAAAKLAYKLQKTDADLDKNTALLEEAEVTYKELVNARDVSIKTAQEKIESIKAGINEMKIKQAQAEMAELASGMVAELGSSGDTLNRLETMVAEERNKAAGRARVARDGMDVSDVQLKAGEQEALANQALADFAAAEGIDLGDEGGESSAPSESSGSEKTMGPSSSEAEASPE